MSDPYLGEIRIASFNFAPKGWAMFNGQLLPINQNQALFALLGTQFGGNGQTNFALPDMRGRMPIHEGAGYVMGQRGGAQTHTLTLAELPPHAHGLKANTALATGTSPAAALPGKKGRLGRDMFAAPANPTGLSEASVTPTGGSQPHQNMQPYLGVNFMIALVGIFPSYN